MRVARDDGVIVDGHDQTVLRKHIALNVVDDVVAAHHIGVSVHLDMKADQAVAGTVVVDHQIVDAQHAGVAQRLFLNMGDQGGVGRCAQQRVDGIPHERCAAVQNKPGNTQTHHAVNAVEPGEVGQHRGDQHGGGGDDIVAGIGGGCHQGFRVDAPADGAVQARHPELDKNGSDQHQNHRNAEGNLGGMQNLFKAAFQQLDADDKDHHGYGKPCQILIPGVSIRMLGIGGARPQPEADQADQIGACIRKVVQAVCRDGNTARKYADGGFAGKQQQVADNADKAGKVAVGGANLAIRVLFVVFNKGADQKIDQRRTPAFLTGRYGAAPISKNGGLV